MKKSADYRYFASRLEDPSLLERAIVVVGLLAVPVGGKRRGGWVSVGTAKNIRESLALLDGQSGFPNLRNEGPLVCWGEPDTTRPPGRLNGKKWAEWHVESGRYYGYSEKAIREFVLEKDGPAMGMIVFDGWVDLAEAEALLAGLGIAISRKRIQRTAEQLCLPATVYDGKWWFRREQLLANASGFLGS